MHAWLQLQVYNQTACLTSSRFSRESRSWAISRGTRVFSFFFLFNLPTLTLGALRFSFLREPPILWSVGKWGSAKSRRGGRPAARSSSGFLGGTPTSQTNSTAFVQRLRRQRCFA